MQAARSNHIPCAANMLMKKRITALLIVLSALIGIVVVGISSGTYIGFKFPEVK